MPEMHARIAPYAGTGAEIRPTMAARYPAVSPGPVEGPSAVAHTAPSVRLFLPSGAPQFILGVAEHVILIPPV